MKSGSLRHVITYRAKTQTLDEYGGPVETWSDFATIRAEALPLMGAIDGEFSALRAVLPPPAVPAPTQTMAASTDPQLCRSLLERLERLLAENDTYALTVLEDNAAVLRVLLDENYESFARQIRYFNFEQARNMLKEARPDQDPAAKVR